MDSQLTPLSALESKITQVADLCHSLRAENRELRARLASAELERERLTEKMETARQRIEALAGQLPEAAP